VGIETQRHSSRLTVSAQVVGKGLGREIRGREGYEKNGLMLLIEISRRELTEKMGIRLQQ
jgi:hypothetical protein